MLSVIHQHIGFSSSSDLALLTLKGIGLQYIDTPSYSWDNRNRKDSHCAIQYCIDGEGAIEVDGIKYPLRQKDAFIIDIPEPALLSAGTFFPLGIYISGIYKGMSSPVMEDTPDHRSCNPLSGKFSFFQADDGNL